MVFLADLWAEDTPLIGGKECQRRKPPVIVRIQMRRSQSAAAAALRPTSLLPNGTCGAAWRMPSACTMRRVTRGGPARGQPIGL